MNTEKFCTKCGRKFIATGREVICPACREAAAEATKKAAVLRAKRASWRGESVPVRISGRASTVIRRYGEANSLPFAAALDALLKASDFFTSLGVEWDTITPYKSRCRDKSTDTEPQDAQGEPVKQAAKITKKASASKATKTSKTVAARKEGKK